MVLLFSLLELLVSGNSPNPSYGKVVKTAYWLLASKTKKASPNALALLFFWLCGMYQEILSLFVGRETTFASLLDKVTFLHVLFHQIDWLRRARGVSGVVANDVTYHIRMVFLVYDCCSLFKSDDADAWRYRTD